MDIKSKILKIEDVCNRYGFKETRVRYMVFSKQIPFIKIGASIRFDELELHKWIESKKQGVKV